MSRSLTAVVAVLVVIAVPSTAAATPQPGECEGGSNGHAITGVCPGTDSEPEPPPADPPTCSWERASYSDLRNPTGVDPNVQFGDGYIYTSSPDGAVRRDADGRVQRAFKAVNCEPGAPNRNGAIDWRDDVTVDDLIAIAGAAAERAIEPPTFAINPPGIGYVNLGMWLAVGNAEPIELPVGTFPAGPWVIVRATVTSTTWDMGNGDTVTCDGPGVALQPDGPGWDNVEEGPCGYTYRWFTPVDETVTITVTTTWTVTWTTSDGRTQASNPPPPIVRTSSTTYDVDEVYTKTRED